MSFFRLVSKDPPIPRFTDNILQVVAALSMAYISYYVADTVVEMSGIVACSTMGIVTSSLGKGLINDEELMDTYLALMEHSLSTILFACGGVVWGVAISGGIDPSVRNAKEWVRHLWGRICLAYVP